MVVVVLVVMVVTVMVVVVQVDRSGDGDAGNDVTVGRGGGESVGDGACDSCTVLIHS